MIMFAFALDEEQIETLAEWMKEHKKSPAVDGGCYSYMFFPTTLGTVVKVKNEMTGEEIDLTDYESW